MANAPARNQSATDVARAWESLRDRISVIADANPVEAFDIASMVIDQIATATTPEQIFAANESGPLDMEEYLGQRLEVTESRYTASAEKFRKGTLGYYVVFEAIDPQGEKVTISCGAPNVVATIFRLYELNFFGNGKTFPVTVRGRETPNGTLYTVHAG